MCKNRNGLHTNFCDRDNSHHCSLYIFGSTAEYDVISFGSLIAALQHRNPLNEIHRIMETNPNYIEETKNGMLPLHYACKRNAPLEVLEFLIQQYPASVKEKDNQGKLPLHYACKNNAPIQVLEFLVQQYPDSFKEKSYYCKRLPLHFACMNNAPLEVLEFLVQRYPDSVMEKEYWGKLPLHLAWENNAPLQVLEFLVQQYPDAALLLHLESCFCEFHCFVFMLLTTLQG